MKNKIVLQTWILTESSMHIAQALKSLLRQKHGTLTFTMDLSVAISISYSITYEAYGFFPAWLLKG